MGALAAVLLLLVMFAGVALLGTLAAALHDWLARRARAARWRAGARGSSRGGFSSAGDWEGRKT